MELKEASDLLALLGHPGRLSVFRLLARRYPEGVPATEIAHALGLKPNTLSVYVGGLARAGLVRAERQGRTILYSLAPERAGSLVAYLVADCCRGRPDICAPVMAREAWGTMADKTYNVLFICTGNSARSIFAEALLRDEGGAKFNAYSAGTRPSGAPNPYALEVLERGGHGAEGLRSKSIAEFQGAEAPAMDFVFTVCDSAANEDCPPWEGQPMSAHWGMPDPVKVQGTEAEKAYAFAQAYAQMRRRVLGFVALPFEQLDRISLQSRLDEIGQPVDA